MAHTVLLFRRSMATAPPVMIGHVIQHTSSLPVQKFPELWKPDSKVRCNLQAVSRPPFTAEAQARFQASPCNICVKQSGNGTDWSPRAAALSVSTSSLVHHVQLFAAVPVSTSSLVHHVQLSAALSVSTSSLVHHVQLSAALYRFGN